MTRPRKREGMCMGGILPVFAGILYYRQSDGHRASPAGSAGCARVPDCRIGAGWRVGARAAESRSANSRGPQIQGSIPARLRQVPPGRAHHRGRPVAGAVGDYHHHDADRARRGGHARGVRHRPRLPDPQPRTGVDRRAGGGGRGAAGRGPRAHVGAADRHRVDDTAAERGKKTYASECVTCHATSARGTDSGANLIRSSLVLRDRYGSAIGPFLKKGHPMQTGAPSASLTAAQITDLSHFIWQRVNDTLQGSPAYDVKDVLTGDPEGRPGVLRRGRPVHDLPLAHRGPGRVRPAIQPGRHPAAVRVPLGRGARAAAPARRSGSP